MRRWPLYLALTLLALPALAPLVAPGLPRSNDHLPHFYRLVELDALVRQGVWLPRWAPDLVHGYGYPVFNYFPYLAHYVAELLHWFGPDLLTAYKLTIALTLVGAAWSASALGTALFRSAWAGLLVGMAYLYSPYLLYDAHIRGSLPETLALALLPAVLLVVHQVAATPGTLRHIGLGALLVAAMVLAHNGVSLQSLPFVGVFGLWALRHAPAKRRALLSLTALFALGLALAAFFLAPALLEAPFAQIERGAANAPMNYRNNFLTLAELFRLPAFPLRPDLLNPPVVRALPTLALVLALIALWRWRQWRVEVRQTYLVVAAGLGITLFFTSPIAQPLWDNIPLLQLTLFPWRVLGLASLFSALLAGALVHWPFRGRAALTAASLVGLLTFALPFYTLPQEPVPAAPTLADVAKFEDTRAFLFVGTTSVGEYLPRWVQTLPDTAAMQAQLLAGQPPTRVPPESLPAGVTLTPGHRTPLGETFIITSPAPFTLTYQTFYFPGWAATLNEQPAPLHISEPYGLMQVAVPAGQSTVRFYFGATPVRTISGWVSALAAVLALGLLFWPRPAVEKTTNPAPLGSDLAPPLALALTLATLAIWALVRPMLVVPGLQADGSLQGVAQPLNQDFHGELVLLGWEADKTAMGADDTLLLNLYWRATPNIHTPSGVRVRLVDAAGRGWSDPETVRPRDWRYAPYTHLWPPEAFILDPYLITPYVGTPPGDYAVEVTVFSYADLRALTTHTIPGFSLNRFSQRAAAVPLASLETVALDSFTLDRTTTAPGEVLTLVRVWQQTRAGDGPTLNIALVNAMGQTLTETTEVLPALLPGEVVRRVTELRLPAITPSGAYTWQVSVPGEPPLATAPVQVIAPEHVFTAPTALTSLQATLGPITLVGYAPLSSTLSAGQTLPLTLFWQAQTETTVSYQVFVHLLDGTGALVAQADGVPAERTRPTTGWVPGEFIADPRPLALPATLAPGEYTLWAGLYDIRDGSRLITSDYPEGRVLVGRFTVP